MDRPFYKGTGNHSVKELEALCASFQERIHELNSEPRLTKAWEDLDLTYLAIGQIYGEDGLERIKKRVSEKRAAR